MGAPDRLNQIWYQSFHQMEMAPALVGATRESCRTYIGHFLKNWSHRKDAFDDVLEAFTDNFLEARQSRRRLCALPRLACRPHEDDAGRGADAAADRGADLRALGRARSAVSLCVDRSPAARRLQISISRCSMASDISRIARIPIARHSEIAAFFDKHE